MKNLKPSVTEVSQTSQLTTVAQLAKRYSLKAQQAKGETEWHGVNPFEEGATHDGFVLNNDGTAYDRKLNRRYTSADVAQLAGLSPGDYEPYRRFIQRRSYDTASSTAPSPATAQHKTSNITKAFNWSRATIHQYRDENGVLLYEVGRIGSGSSKTIRQRTPDERGGWVSKLGNVRRVLYRMSEVLRAHTVVICEGETDADALQNALEREGLTPSVCATTNPHGACNWREEYNAVLEGRAVIIWPDADEPGARHAQGVAQSVAPVARECKVVQVPDAHHKEGAADWFARGMSAEAYLQLADNVAGFEAATKNSELFDAPATNEPPRRRYTFLSAKDLKARASPEELVRGLLQVNTLAAIIGDAASYKSFTALGIAASIASGLEWQGRTTKKGSVLYIAGEGSAGLKQRVQAWEIRHAQEMGVIFLPEAVQLHRPDDVNALLWEIPRLTEKPSLIIIDTLARCFNGGDENSARDAGLFIAGLDRLRASTGATVLVLHHVTKKGDSRGSTAFAGAFDTMIETRRNEGSKSVTLSCRKQKDAEEFSSFSLIARAVELAEQDEHGKARTSLVLELTDTPNSPPAPVARADATRIRILDVLRAAPNGLRASGWQRACESFISSSRFYDFRNALVNSGEVVEENKVYHCTTPVTPTTPKSEQLHESERQNYSDHSGAFRELEESEQLFHDEEQNAAPNDYGLI